MRALVLAWLASVAAYSKTQPFSARGRPRGVAATEAGAAPFSLDSVRASLIRQEETIIFGLIERTQFALNAEIYRRGAQEFDLKLLHPGLRARDVSFLEVMLFETEQVHARARRYLSPEEHAFFPEHVAEPAIAPLAYPEVLVDDGYTVNGQIMDAYIGKTLPRGCANSDDGQHGSAAIADIAVLQALSRRVHYGKFVAESKYARDAGAFEGPAAAGDIAAIHALLENKAVEDNVVNRALVKATVFGQDAYSGMSPGYKVDPALVASLYRRMIMPLTKQVQVAYLLRRCGHADKVPQSVDEWPAYLRAYAEDEDEVPGDGGY